MASWLTYKCKECGFTVETESRGFYALMSGMYYNFKCSKCKKIVAISANELKMMGYSPRCPQCGKENGLSTWNPIDGSCPKCNGEMEIDKSAGMTLAD